MTNTYGLKKKKKAIIGLIRVEEKKEHPCLRKIDRLIKCNNNCAKSIEQARDRYKKYKANKNKK